MKIIMLGMQGSFERNGFGINRANFEVYNGMKKLENKNDKLQVSKREYDERIVDGLNSGFSTLFKTYFDDFSDFDIIHRLYFKPAFARSPSIKKGAAVITTIHDLLGYLYYPLPTGMLNSAKAFAMKNSVLGIGGALQLDSDAIITVSSQTRDEVASTGFDSKNIHTISLGVDHRFSKARKSNGRQNGKFVVGYIGAPGQVNKNCRMVFEAANALKSDKKIEFQFTGNLNYGTESKPLMRYASQNGLGNIRMLGFVPENRLVDTYDGFNIFVWPSYYDGFALPILEAQARKLPVIIYKGGKIPQEVRKYCIEAKDSGHMAEIIESIKKGGYNESKLKRARDYARSFTWGKTVSETLRVYKKYGIDSQ